MSKQKDLFSPQMCKTRAQRHSSRLIPGKGPVRKKKVVETPVVEEDFSGWTLAELKEERQRSIKAMDFERGEQITRAITRFQVYHQSSAFLKGSKWLSDGIDDAVRNYTQNRQELEDESEDLELTIRLAIRKQFEVVKRRHINNLTVLEVERCIEMMKEETRPFPAAINMQRAAQTLALDNQYEEAKFMRWRIETETEQEVIKRTENVTKSYDELMRKLMDKQREELAILEVELQRKLDAVTSDFNKRSATLDKAFVVYIQHMLQRTITDVCEQLGGSGRRGEVSAALGRLAADKLNGAQTIPQPLVEKIMKLQMTTEAPATGKKPT